MRSRVILISSLRILYHNLIARWDEQAANASGAAYASTVTVRDGDGREVPVAHACGHDVHVACLAGAGPSPAQNGRAVAGLMVPGGHPAVTEVAASYPGATAVQVYHSINESLAACTAFPVDLGGVGVTVHITPQNLPQVADASSAYGGTFNASGRNQSLQVEVVLDRKIVVVVVYVDNVPPSNAIYGDLQSTAAAAVGKLA